MRSRATSISSMVDSRLAARRCATGSGTDVTVSAMASSRWRRQSARCSSSRARNELHVVAEVAAVAAGEVRVADMCTPDGTADAATDRRPRLEGRGTLRGGTSEPLARPSPPRRRTDRAATGEPGPVQDRKSTRLNSSHANISDAVFCLKKKYYITQRFRQ